MDSFEHPVHMRDRKLDVVILVLSCSTLRRQQGAPVDLLEIAIGKLVVTLRAFGMRGVDAQMPPAILAKTVALDECILFLRGGLVLAPCVAIVDDYESSVDECLRVIKGARIQVECLMGGLAISEFLEMRQVCGDGFGHRRAVEILRGQSACVMR